MKTRTFFVSNSSSSSFVVTYRLPDYGEFKKQKPLLSNINLKLLKKFGFKYVQTNNPDFIGTPAYPYKSNIRSFKNYEGVYLGYEVVCNQDDVIYFLLKNKIPFVSLCHYGEEVVCWDGKSPIFHFVDNTLNRIIQNQEKNIPICSFLPTTDFDVKDWMEDANILRKETEIKPK